MSLRERLSADLKQAMKARDQARVSVLRMARAALRNAEIEAGQTFDSDEEIIPVLAREAKQRRESIQEFEKGDRPDLAQKEQAELAILADYLPEEMSAEELERVVQETIAEVGATSPRDMGDVMKALMPKIRGRADGKEANALVRQALSGE
jgi:uncharacterized protein YqeY